MGNVVPYIAKEEEKLEEEAHKMLGTLSNGKIISADFAISASCNRVPVIDGHTESVSVKLKNKASADEIITALTDFRGQVADLNLPSAPKQIIYYDSAPDRPQPRLDLNRGNGMTASVGRLRSCNILDWKFTVLSHNVIRGAAGACTSQRRTHEGQGIPRLMPIPFSLQFSAPRSTPWSVMKFGGTSVEDSRAITRLEGIVRERLGERPVLVRQRDVEGHGPASRRRPCRWQRRS